MPKEKKCKHCGQVIHKAPLEEITVLNIAPEDDGSTEEELIEKISKKAVSEVIETIQPLLEKLKKIAEDHQQSSEANPMLVQQNHLLKLQQEAQAGLQERLKARENNMALRMKKFQAKVASRVPLK